MQYTTTLVMNLMTGQPFIFDVPEEKISRLESQKEAVFKGRAPLLGNSVEDLITNWEFSHFRAFNELLKIFMGDGYTNELITQILLEFGLPESYIHKLIEDERFVDSIRPWFIGITCDGGRAIRTLRKVYERAKQYFSPEEGRPDFDEAFW